jgi:excisionase family DNA binding protein
MYVSLGKAAQQLGVTPGTVRRWTQSGFLPCTRTAGGHRRIDTKDIEELARAIGDGGHLAARRARERELETLAQASLDVASRLDQVELLAGIARHVTRLCRCHTCEILEYDAEQEVVRVLAEYEASGRRRPTAGAFSLRELPVTRRVLDEQVPIVVNADERGADPAEVELMRQYGEKSILMLPLVFQGQAIGLLEACDRERPRRYSPQELRLARALAGHAAVALRNAQLYSAAHDADAAMEALRRRLAHLARKVTEIHNVSPAAELFSSLAEVLRAAFDARSCVIAADGRVLGAAVEPSLADAPAAPEGVPAYVLRAAAPRSGARLELTLVLPRPAAPGEAEVLELAAAMAPDPAATRTLLGQGSE